MKIPPKVQKIAKRLSPRLPAANYGLKSGVRASRIILQGSTLSIVRPPYRFNSQKPLPAFLCTSASRLAHYGAYKNNLGSSVLQMVFPVIIGLLAYERSWHSICRTTEGGEKYLTGLTPYDTALGIHGVTRLDPFWKRFVVSADKERELIMGDQVVESADWRLLYDRAGFLPFAARNYVGNRLGLLSLQLNIKNGSLYLNTTSRVVYFDKSRLAFIGEWDCYLSIGLPYDRFDSAVRDIQQLGKEPDPFEAIRRCKYSDYYEPDFDLKDEKYGAPMAALYNEILPALINIAERFPQGEIPRLSAA
jgi:hypothetical protein